MPLPLLILCIVLLAIAMSVILTLSTKGTLTIEYNGELAVYFSILFVKIKLFPFKKKRQIHKVRSMGAGRAARIRRAVEQKEQKKLERKKARKKKKSEQKKVEKAEKKPEKKKIEREQIDDIIDVLQLAAELVAVLVKRFSKRLRIKVARLKVKVASPDAAVTAVAYGAITQIVNVFLPILSQVKNFDLPKRRQFEVTVDFADDTPEIDFKIAFALRGWHLLDIPFAALKRATPEIPKYVEKLSHYKKSDESDENENNTQEKS